MASKKNEHLHFSAKKKQKITYRKDKISKNIDRRNRNIDSFFQ